MKKNNKGFTLAELLIVVAIIAVLVAIAIPTFTGQLTKAQKNADLANLRAAYAEATARQLDNNDSQTTDIPNVTLSGKLKEEKDIESLPFTATDLLGKDGTITVTFTFPGDDAAAGTKVTATKKT